jgi:hypothetical protein
MPLKFPFNDIGGQGSGLHHKTNKTPVDSERLIIAVIDSVLELLQEDIACADPNDEKRLISSF